MNARKVAALTAYLSDHPKAPRLGDHLWPGRNYAGVGEWRAGPDWDKPMDYESFHHRRFRAVAEGIGRLTPNSTTDAMTPPACGPRRGCR